jgi:hypothetical protein
MLTKKIAFCFTILVLCICAEAVAVPIIYTLSSGSGSGTLGGETFSNVPLALSVAADTSQIVNGGNYQITNLTATISISGFATATFTAPYLRMFAAPRFGGVGFASYADNDMLIQDLLDLVNNPALMQYHLDTSFGPLTGTGAVNPGEYYPTDKGELTFFSVPTVTFQAKIVPEPSTAALLVGCVVALVVRRR